MTLWRGKNRENHKDTKRTNDMIRTLLKYGHVGSRQWWDMYFRIGMSVLHPVFAKKTRYTRIGNWYYAWRFRRIMKKKFGKK